MFMTQQHERTIDTLTFAQFMAQLPELRGQYPLAVDCTRTRLQGGPPLRLHTEASQRLQLPARGHRCHIAQAWVQRLAPLQLPQQQVLVSQGVRHSLALLMAHWAGLGLRVAIPADVYPVYAQLCADAVLQFGQYPLHPGLLPVHWSEADVLLVTNPVKPRGDVLDARELAHITDWLAQSAQRRVVVDAVYDLQPELHASTRTLWATGQAIVLHSLSKAWLSPLLAGVAVVPASDVARLEALFRDQVIDRQRLAQAEAWLQQQPDFPTAVGGAFDRARTRLAQRLQAQGLVSMQGTSERVSGYLVRVACSVEAGAQAGFLGLPGSAFGAPQRPSPITVFSALDGLAD